MIFSYDDYTDFLAGQNSTLHFGLPWAILYHKSTFSFGCDIWVFVIKSAYAIEKYRLYRAENG